MSSGVGNIGSYVVAHPPNMLSSQVILRGSELTNRRSSRRIGAFKYHRSTHAANAQCADDDRDNICRAMHSMDVLYNQTLRQLDKSFRRLEAMLPPPQRMRHGNSFVFRYKEKTVHQALIQKLARMVSGLHAARLLCDNGFFQEQGAIATNASTSFMKIYGFWPSE